MFFMCLCNCFKLMVLHANIIQLNCRLEINKNQSVWEVQCDDKGFPLDLNYSEYDHPDGYIDSFLSGVETKQLPK